jgi:nucleoside-diphosphate-sugar epimerase
MNIRRRGAYVVVSGFAGAGGLGSHVARRLAARKIKVIVLDVAPLAADARTSDLQKC